MMLLATWIKHPFVQCQHAASPSEHRRAVVFGDQEKPPLRPAIPRTQPHTPLRFAKRPSPKRGEGSSPHIGGVTPSRPTLTLAASSVPSSFFVAPKMMIFAPGFSSDLSPATKVTIGVSGGTTTFFSPSLYLTRMFWPSVPFTVSATVALVMVLPGRWSHGRKPSAAPRWASGQIWTATAFWVPSG